MSVPLDLNDVGTLPVRNGAVHKHCCGARVAWRGASGIAWYRGQNQV